MKTAFVVASLVLISTNLICASERIAETHAAQEGVGSRFREQLAQDDDPRADILSGEFFIHRTSERLDCKAGLSWMTGLAETGDAEAMFELGTMYETGSCAPVSEPKALAWLRKAAENGNNAAPGSLGKTYYSGNNDLGTDYSQALLWFSKGAMIFDAQSFYYLGSMYQDGKGVTRNHNEAYKLFDIAMHLYPFRSEHRAMALLARDRSREVLTPGEVTAAGLASRRLLEALLEHDTQMIHKLFPQEALAALQASER